MGNWSATIMGGDGPLDAQHDVLDLAGFDDNDGERSYDEHLPEVKDLLEKVPADAWEPFFKQGRHEDYSNDKRRVAAVLLMECGATIPPFVAQEALKACEESVRAWNDPAERTFYLQQFAETIKAYDGTPTTIPSEGLFEKMAGHGSSPKPPR